MVEVLLTLPSIVLSMTHFVAALLAFAMQLLCQLITGERLKIAILVLMMMDGLLLSGLIQGNGCRAKDSKVHIYLAGDSSGGNIVHNVAFRAIESDVKVLGNILLNPMFGGQERTESEKRLDGKYFVTLQDRDWYWRAYL